MDSTLTVLVVEDNDDLRETVAEVLVRHGHGVIAIASAEEVDEGLTLRRCDIAIIDLNLPGEDGLSLADRLKRAQPDLRVIMMTTRVQLEDRVHGYRSGADLYLPKPVANAELVAAIEALGRQLRLNRFNGHEQKSSSMVRFNPRALELNGPSGSVLVNEGEALLVSALARAPEQRLDYWQLLELCALGMDDEGKAALKVRMSRLRAKLDRIGCPGNSLKSLRMTGYQLCVSLTIV